MVDKSYETVSLSLTQGEIPLDKVTGYFAATPPRQVIIQLIAEPLSNGATESGKIPSQFCLNEDLLKELVENEVAVLLTKIEDLRDKLKSNGLDRLVVPYPENTSSDEELFQAFYGSYGVK
jgi:hypothetical protein